MSGLLRLMCLGAFVMSLAFCHLPGVVLADAVTVEVAAGNVDREGVPVSIALPASLQDCRDFTLTREDNGQKIPVQVSNLASPTILWILRERLAAGKSRRYRLAAAAGQTSSPTGVVAKDDGKRLAITVAGKPVLVYNQAIVPSPDPKHPYYAKSGYLHPVYNPLGQVVTDDFNPDHAHQHGIMFAWRKTTFEGRPTNGWDQKAGHGRVEHVKLEDYGGGPVFGFFTARLHQVDLSAPGRPKPVLDETWSVRVYNLPNRFLFDIAATQTCASGVPVVIDEIHYGGLMIRGHAAWHKGRDFDYCTSEGRTKKDGSHTRPRWVDMFGPLAGQVTGVAILDHPDNYRFPQPVRLHPTMPYFCFTPAVLGSFTIEPGTPYRWRYRFCVHDGPLDAMAADRLWEDYAHPPSARIVPD